MAFNPVQEVARYLQDNQEKNFTVREIAEWIFQTHSDERKEKQTHSTAADIPLGNDATVIQQFIAEISASHSRLQKNTPRIKTTEEQAGKTLLLAFQ